MTCCLALLAAVLPFAEGRPVLHRTAVAPYGFVNTVIRVRFDPSKGVVYGDETATVRTREALDALPFDSRSIRYRSISVDGRPVRFAVDGATGRITVRLALPVPAGTQLAVRFVYSAQPKRGLYFVRPDRAYPHVSPQIWTQGEPSDNCYWFPTWDEPNDKTPSELVIDVPPGWTAIGNGRLARHTVSPAGDRWDWISAQPKSTYLIAFAAGRFSEFHNRLGALAVDSFVRPQDAALNALCFRDTPRIIEYYQHVTGVPYPFSKYDQIAVERFTFGGMEDSSATILTDSFLHLQNEDVERNCDDVISHELAQQWFGDDATMADWSNEWLNEGFATYFEELWFGQQYGEAGFEYIRHEGEELFASEAQHYLRPIVDYRYNDPIDLFDVTGHERAAAVLHMLRYLAGDRNYFAALHTYLIEYQYKNADTKAFFASMQRSLHEPLGWFENEWFFRASYPHYVVHDAYDAQAKSLIVTVRQKNPDGRPFRMPVVIEAYAGGHVSRVRVWIERNLQTVRIGGVDRAPQMVLFDPNENLLRELTFDEPVSRLAYQVLRAAHVGDREWALEQLAALVHAAPPVRTAAERAIRQAALGDAFYGVRADAVGDAAAFGDADAVLASLRDGDVRVRIAAEGAAARLTQPDVRVNAALTIMTRDANPDVASAALESLGKRRAPGAYALLTEDVARKSYHDVVASGALQGLAALGDRRAFALVLQKTAYGVAERERNAAVGALALLAERTNSADRALPVLLRLAESDPLIATRLTATSALGDLGDAGAIPTLERIERNDSQEIVRIQAWTSEQELRH